MDKIFSPIKERIVQYLDNNDISKETFFKKTGISPSNFKGSGAKSEIGGDKIAKILSLFTDINANWLITGSGSMISEKVGIDANNNRDVQNPLNVLTALAEAQKSLAEAQRALADAQDWLAKAYMESAMRLNTKFK